MESRVLSSGELTSILVRDFVCLTVNTDKPPADIEAILREANGVGRRYTLPVFIYVTPDLKVIRKTNGTRSSIGFRGDLEAALRHESIKASPEAEKAVTDAAEQAAKDFEAKHYASAMKLARGALEHRGYCPARAKVADVLERCEAIGRQELDKVVAMVKRGSYDAALAAIEKTRTDFPGPEIEKAAAVATGTIERLQVASKALAVGDAAGARTLYEAILKDAAGTLFEDVAKEKLAKLPAK